VRRRFDAEAGTYTLEIRQHTPATPGQPDKLPLHIPFALGLLDADGNDLPTCSSPARPSRRRRRHPHAGPARAVERFTFVGLNARPVPSLLRGFSAPVKRALSPTRTPS
jgi:aminopeptidase N